jgi:hypothetical protein
MVSKQGLSVFYEIIKLRYDVNENHLRNYSSYLFVDYETKLLEENPAIAFRE